MTFSLFSPDGDEGYPGDVVATASYFLSEDGGVEVTYRAATSKPTPVNMANHIYMNLAGHAAGRDALMDHFIQVDCFYQ